MGQKVHPIGFRLGVFEDWDFWIQLAQHSEILHIDKITAIYRNYGHSGLGFKQDENFLKQSRCKVYDKWRMLLTGEQFEDLIEYREDMIANLLAQLADSEHLISSLQNRIDQNAFASNQREQLLHEKINSLHETINNLHETINDLRKTISALFHSTSWKITAPLRFLVRIIRDQRAKLIQARGGRSR